MANEPLLEVKDLRVALDIDKHLVPILQGVDFTLQPGKILALVGESGCGKSVTANALLRLLPRDIKITGGEILFREPGTDAPVDIAGFKPTGQEIRKIRGNHIAMIFQEPMSSFSPVHTIGNQIMEVIRLHRGVSKAEARDIAADFLGKVGLPDPGWAVDRYAHEYSGGMRQRAMIAKALSCNPSLLIADEPTTALDVTIQAQIIDLLRELQEEFGMAIIFITHDLGVVAQIADEVAIMYTGRIVEMGSQRDIFHRPKHPYTENLIRAIPQLGDLSHRRQLKPIRGNVPSLFEMPPGCAFHPRCDSFIAGHCDEQIPVRTRIADSHSVSCHAAAKEATG
jgi:peptide/nickel transport system ATP-binding protein